MWIIDYGGTWIKFYKVDKNKSFQFISPPTSSLFFYLLDKVLNAEGYKKKESLIIGFPGVVKAGKVITSPNLNSQSWNNVRLQQRLEKYKMKTVIFNDTDLHGHLVIKGKGVELVLALGTGFGSSLFVDGVLVPNLEFGHHLFMKSKTYEELLGYKAYLRSGRTTWVKNMKLAIKALNAAFNPDKIYLTGGMSTHLENIRLPKYVRVVGNPVPSKKSIKTLRNLVEP
jgi:polyphosphate glucokinase